MKAEYQKPTEWKEYKANGIPSNPLEYWYSVVKVGQHYRIYKIFPQFPNPSGDGLTIDDSLPPELYILTERIHLGSKVDDPDSLHLGNDGTIVRAYKTMDEAKKRAVIQVSHIEELVSAYIQDGGSENP